MAGVDEAVARSVQEEPSAADARGFPTLGTRFNTGDAALIVQMSQMADEINPWGRNWRHRDRQLRAMVHAESYLTSTIGALVERNQAFRWVIDGEPQTAAVVHDMLDEAEFGMGFEAMEAKLSDDFYVTDNGAFIEVIRSGPDASDPVVGLAHLDSNRCLRTDRAAEPVAWLEENGKLRLLKRYQVEILTERPSPISSMRGMGTSGVSRVLRWAQLLRDVHNFRREKVGGRSNRSMHFVSGITDAELTSAITRFQLDQDAAGFLRYSSPMVVAGVDPEVAVAVASIDFASIPDGFDLTNEMTWWITLLAVAFGLDYQDLAPLQQGNLGNSQQSLMLDRKSRGKGPAVWQKQFTRAMRNVLPSNVEFRFEPDDPIARREEREADVALARTIKLLGESGAITGSMGAQMALDGGVLSEEVFRLFKAEDVTPDVIVDKAFADLPGESGDEREAVARGPLVNQMQQALDRIMARMIDHIETPLEAE